MLQLPVATQEERARVRLVCLCRGTVDDCPSILQAFDQLLSEDRATLMAFLLSDGVKKLAFSINFLPDFFMFGKTNPYCGLPRTLAVFAGILNALESAVKDHKAVPHGAQGGRGQGRPGRKTITAGGGPSSSSKQMHFK